MRPSLLLLPVVLLATHVSPRPIVVTGIVKSPTGIVLEGANVFIPASAASAVTDGSGRYVLNVRADDGATLAIRARAIAFAPESKSLTVPAGVDTIVADFVLKPDINRLSEVVVTASGTATERAVVAFSVSRVAQAPPTSGTRATAQADTSFNTEEYGLIEENPFKAVRGNPLSTFSVDVDRASYSNTRRFIREGQLPPEGAVRLEELVNYFQYGYAAPTGKEPIAIHADAMTTPWNPHHQIVRVALQAKRVPTETLPTANLVFLIDVSGSMDEPDKLPLVKEGFRILVGQLRPQDRVALVVYAGNAGLVLPSTPASDKQTILAAIDRLEAGGSTAGGAGIQLAYKVARDNFVKGGNNRVILATDGDFNVGVSSTAELDRLIEERRADGVFLTVLGFGTGNLKDSRMEQLADKGNGNYAYIDNGVEARKVFVTEFGGTLFTVAKDVKIQVEFNPSAVQAWRLLGYENRVLASEDFQDDRKDAGDMGSGHTVTALYEVVPVGAPLDVDVGSTPALRYQRVTSTAKQSPDELLNVSVRYKDPDGDRSRLMRQPVAARSVEASADDRFTMAVAGYAMLLHRSKYVGSFDFDHVIALATSGAGLDSARAEFITMARTTRELAAKASLARRK